jgi:SAM-dependent methyltransferase
VKHQSDWKPSKFVWRRGRLRASRDRRVIGVGSRLIADRVAAFYAKQVPLNCKGRLLDLGCGMAPLFHVYQPFVDEIICVDWPNSAHEIQHVDIHCDLSGPVPLPDNHFDTVILSDVLEHLPNPEQVCTEISRMLRPGGCLLANVPFYYPLHEEPHDYFRYTEFALRRFLGLAQLEVELIESIGGPIEIVADISSKLACAIPLIGSVLAETIQGFAAATNKLPLLRGTFTRLAAKFPLGYVIVARKRVTATTARSTQDELNPNKHDGPILALPAEFDRVPHFLSGRVPLSTGD